MTALQFEGTENETLKINNKVELEEQVEVEVQRLTEWQSTEMLRKPLILKKYVLVDLIGLIPGIMLYPIPVYMVDEML